MTVSSPSQPFSPLPAVLFVIGCKGDTVRYRCDHPQEQLVRQGLQSASCLWTDLRVFGRVLDYDIFVLHRVMYAGLVPELLDVLARLGKVAIFDTDDLVFEPGLTRHDSLLSAMPPERARLWQQNIRLHLETLERCDYALAPTEYLAERLARRGKQSFVHRNALNVELLKLSNAAYQDHWQRQASPDREKESVRIAYFSGSPSHDRDFALVEPVLQRLMERYPQVRLSVFGYLSLGDDWARFEDRVEQVPFMPWQELPQAIGRVDINLAPLELENPYCQSKSELKYFEAGVVGVPTVASPTQAFQFAIQHGENGLLSSTPEEWYANLETLILDPARRREMGEAARRHVLAHYTPDVRGEELVSTLSHVWQGFRSRFPERDDGQPARYLIDRLCDYYARRTRGGAIPTRTEQIIAQLTAELERRQRLSWRGLWNWAKEESKRVRL